MALITLIVFIILEQKSKLNRMKNDAKIMIVLVL